MFAPRFVRTGVRAAKIVAVPRINMKPQVRFFSDSASGTDAAKPAEPAAEPAAAQGGKSPEVEKLEEEVKNLKDSLMRAYAEGENIRRIAQRDVENARMYANSSFAKAILDISDDLERALSIIPAEKRKTGDAIFDQLVIGIEMTEKNMQKTLNKFHVTKYGATGEKFDPNLHDALFQVPDPSKEPDTIAQIIKHGYKIKDRVLRPAQVGAVVKP